MKILIVSPGATWATADVEAGLVYGLQQHGVTIVRYALDGRIDRARSWLFHAWRRARKHNPAIGEPTTADVFYQAGEGVIAMALRNQVDVVLVVSAMFLHPDVITLLKRAGLRVVVLFTETPYDLDHELRVAAMVDGCWTHERSVIETFRRVNPRTGYVRHGWHPERHRAGVQPGDELHPAHDVVFVGSAFQERIELLAAIDWTGIDLGLYGSWRPLPRRHPLRRFVREGVVDNVRAAALYRRAAIGLNLYRTSKGWGRDAPQIDHAESLNPRAYELARCGVFSISAARDEVTEIFGDFVPTFSYASEASALIRRWLPDADGRAQLAQQASGRVAEDSWTARAAQVIGDLQVLIGAGENANGAISGTVRESLHVAGWDRRRGAGGELVEVHPEP